MLDGLNKKRKFVVLCTEKHIADPQEGRDWECPKCGESGFYVYESVNYDCEKIHPKDLLLCDKCNHSEYAKTFISKLNAKLSMVECPCCKGKGIIKAT